MATSKTLFTGRRELTMAEYEALETIDLNKDYNITDYPTNGITNEQMTFALTCNRLFPENSTFTCIDNGTYGLGKTYKIKIVDDVKTWEEVPSGGGSSGLIIELGQAMTSLDTKVYPSMTVAQAKQIRTAIQGGVIPVIRWSPLGVITDIVPNNVSETINKITITLHGKIVKYTWNNSDADTTVINAEFDEEQSDTEDMKYSSSSAHTSVDEYGQGYIDYQISATQKLRYAYGLWHTGANLTFDTPFTTILFANSTVSSGTDAQTQRTTIIGMSNTGLNFNTSSDVKIRWQAWGLINL